MRSPRRLLLAVVAGVLVIAAAGWAVGTRLRSPADEAALRKPPEPSLVTAPVELTRLVSTVVVSGTLEYGSPVPVMLAGVVGGADPLQRATRAPRPGRIKEGAVIMEVNGRPVIALAGTVPMHRTITPGAEGADVRQLQKALRRLGHQIPVTGVFDQATVAAVTRFYARKGYQAQQPTLEARQQLGTLRKAVRTARETLATEQKALDEGRDVLPLKIKARNARTDLKIAEKALREAEAEELTPEDEAKLDAAEAAVRDAEEKLAEARRELDQARRETAPPATPGATPAPKPTADVGLLELKVAGAEAALDAARRALVRTREEIGTAREKRLETLRKAVRDGREALAAAEQALRQARRLSPERLKVADAKTDLAEANALLAEFRRTYGTAIPPGELVFLPKLPARLQTSRVRAGETVDKAVATVTSSSFAVPGSVDATESRLLKEGLKAVIETDSGKTFPATLTAVGEKARPADAESGGKGAKDGGEAQPGSEPVLITPSSMKGLKSLSGTTVTARVTVGATDGEVLVVPVAAVITAADGRPRVQVEVAPDRTKEVEVRTGLTADGKVQVTGPLKAGDRVVVGDA
ncbi:peptidoglycan-binding domain-containing protein [Sphaerisporangium fuscum]|uniref:peptidoglycan-binding domain-containing protein n=1 Tax=Sphaerisporangium fuscum TaxID=2835868 RepID=UPI001BDBD39E|nr:peptidoglycan-binding domain-containing protein [Sphaerisporangium fuscum]